MSPSSSRWLPVQPERIPAALRQEPWVLWRAEPRGLDKPAKVPYQIAWPRRRASSTAAASWGSFTDAVEAYHALAALTPDPLRGPVGGIGCVLTPAAQLTCLDLDSVLGPAGDLDPHAGAIVARCGSWTERSPSGAGLHVFVRGRVPRALKGRQIEVYSEARYICVTGATWRDAPDEIRDGQPYLNALAAAAQTPDRPRPPYGGPTVPPPDDPAGALRARLAAWGVAARRVKPWLGGTLAEIGCPWADEHTSGGADAAVILHPSGALDFTCLHAHCTGRRWREFRARMQGRAA
jgi:hypothetical protein